MSIIEELRQRRGMMDAKEVAPLIGMNLNVLYRKSKAGAIPNLRYFGKVKFDPRVLAEWLEEHDVCAGSAGRR